MAEAVAEVIEDEVVEEVVNDEVHVEDEVVSGEEPEAKPESTEEEFVVSIGEESPPQEEKAPEWVKELRIKQRETSKENRQLKEKLQAYEQVKPTALGVKPTLESSEYDSEKFDTDLAAWYERKATVDKEQSAANESKEIEAKKWQGTLDNYAEKREAVKAKVGGFEEAEATAQESLSDIQQSIILQGAKDPALFILALGKDPKKLAELSSIKDHAKFIWQAAQMEAQLKTGSRKVTTAPEGKVVSKAGAAGMGNKTFDKLMADAEKSNDYSEVNKFERENRKQE